MKRQRLPALVKMHVAILRIKITTTTTYLLKSFMHRFIILKQTEILIFLNIGIIRYYVRRVLLISSLSSENVSTDEANYDSCISIG